MNIPDIDGRRALCMTEKTTDGPHRAYAPETDHWYVVQYRAGVNNRTFDMMLKALRHGGFEYYRPMFMRMKRPTIDGRRVGDMRRVTEPLYPNYMFVRRERAGKAPIGSIHGIEGNFLGAVRDQVVRAHQAEEIEGFIQFVRKNDPSRKLIKAGDTVETLDGLIEAVVNEVHADGRLSLLSSFMGGSSRLVVNLAQVVRTKAAPEPKARKVKMAKVKIVKPGEGGVTAPEGSAGIERDAA